MYTTGTGTCTWRALDLFGASNQRWNSFTEASEVNELSSIRDW